MKTRKLKEAQQLIFGETVIISPERGLILNKDRFLQVLNEIESQDNLDSIRTKVLAVKSALIDPRKDVFGVVNVSANGDTVPMRQDLLVSEMDQILESQTLERASYYLRRLKSGIGKIRTNKINEINLLRWKEYDDVITDSLWILERRDTSGAHWGGYWGNFIPQIPHQMLIRYTKKGDWVLDTFVGSGTTLIECRRLGRNGIGIELNPEVAQQAMELIAREPNRHSIVSDVVIGDSRALNLKEVLAKQHIRQVQFLIMHPPYHDIIKFSRDPRDLSNAETVDDFLKMFGEVVENTTPFLEKDRYLAVVIGDKYSKGEWIPLGFYCVQEVFRHGYSLKSIVVKNFEETRGKRNQKELWRYRALVGGFYVFKHEYILLFKKK
jgi:hypothetical protein